MGPPLSRLVKGERRAVRGAFSYGVVVHVCVRVVIGADIRI